MNDMTPVIVPKSDQISADDLIAGPMTVTIREVKITAGAEQPVSIFLEDQERAYRPCKSMSRVLVQAWGPDAKKYIGRSLTLYRDPTVKWGGMEVGGIRISHMSDIDGAKQMMLTATKGSRKPFKVLPLASAPAAMPTTDFNAVLADLKEVAQPGNLDALGAAWKNIGPDARKALAAELPALKAACAVPEDDVPFDADPAAEKTAALLANLTAAENAKAVEAVAKEYNTHKDALTDEQAISVETAISKARARFEEPVE